MTRRSKQIWAAVLASLGIVFFATGLWLFSGPAWVFVRWRATDAQVLQSEVSRLHDGSGDLLFRVHGKFQIQSDGRTIESEGDDDLVTSDFADAENARARVLEGSVYKVYVDPSKPGNVRFFTQSALDVFATSLLLILAGLTSLGGSWLIWRAMNIVPPRCPDCSAVIKRHFKFCPDCGGALSADNPVKREVLLENENA
jgi:hypothetical protein